MLLAVHIAQLAEHGGDSGIRDHGLLESALARPLNLAAYQETDAAALAASYAVALAKNHPFIDGNKRVAFIAMELFLQLNNIELTATDADCVTTMLGVATGELKEEALADWLRKNSRYT
ncbi:MAG: type II toxin-antitoxin system death-on-curing family toxin [Betaproteobacteria bacterium]|nr:type II toxin-antitoxin system death-on-curing family toxin [Betaproteobacteria bacterium]